jgi:hypothetical protein
MEATMSGQDQGDGVPSMSLSSDEQRGATPTDLAAVVQGLDTPEQQKAAAEGVIGAMSSDAKQDLAATVVQGLDTPEQQKAAAEGVMSAVPIKQRQQVAQSPTPET